MRDKPMTKPFLTREQAASLCAGLLDEKFFKAFSEPARAAVFRELVILGRADIGAIAEGLPQDRSVVSRHLKVLAEAGIVSAVKEGRSIFYDVNATEIERRLEEMLKITRLLRITGESGCAMIDRPTPPQ